IDADRVDALRHEMELEGPARVGALRDAAVQHDEHVVRAVQRGLAETEARRRYGRVRDGPADHGGELGIRPAVAGLRLPESERPDERGVERGTGAGADAGDLEAVDRDLHRDDRREPPDD